MEPDRGSLWVVIDPMRAFTDTLGTLAAAYGNEELSTITATVPSTSAAATNVRTIVQGDTTTAFAAALAAFYQQIPIGHVEAGLRTDNILDPYPEEANRRLISQIAQLHFAPTYLAVENLHKSGVTGAIHETGNTVIDALLDVAKSQPPCNVVGLDSRQEVV